MKGASLRSVAELLGHRGLRMVMRYAHLSPEHLSAEVGLLDPTPTPTLPPAPEETARSERARKGQRASTRDQRRAKVVEFPKEIGSPHWTISATGSSVKPRKRLLSIASPRIAIHLADHQRILLRKDGEQGRRLPRFCRGLECTGNC
jgi:hypothetical protein